MPNVPGKITKHRQFLDLLQEHGWITIRAEEWKLLRERFAESSLRQWLAEEGIAVDQPYRGVETKTFETLEASLTAMGELYARDGELRKACRATVILAKDRTRFASRNPNVAPAKRAVKAEMVEWMLVWLGDPGMFPAWCAVRKNASPLSFHPLP
jgi:hypothetical protein